MKSGIINTKDKSWGVRPLDLKEKVKLLPESPGVYLMKDFSGNIIYVGKSKNLKSRVGQYFQNSRNHSPKVVKMVQCIRDFEFVTTDTEFEALLLECRLIKDIKPMFNSQMKHHNRYVYIKITTDEEYPRILVVQEILDDGCLYFGPYVSRKNVERATEAIKNNYRIGNCIGTNISNNKSGCLNYQMGLCIGACADPGLKKEYMDNINDTINFLSGRNNKIMDLIEKKMTYAAEKLNFDKAAKYRDDIYALKQILNKQRVISFSQRIRSIVVLEHIDADTLKVFLLSNSKLLYEEKVEAGKLS
jgi:excinuclease ABC subunit C